MDTYRLAELTLDPWIDPGQNSIVQSDVFFWNKKSPGNKEINPKNTPTATT